MQLISAIDCIFGFLRSLFFVTFCFSDIESSFEYFLVLVVVVVVVVVATFDDQCSYRL